MYDRGWVSKKRYRYNIINPGELQQRRKRQMFTMIDNISQLHNMRDEVACNLYVMPTTNFCNKLLQGYRTMIICDRLASTLHRGRLRRGTSGQLTFTSRRKEIMIWSRWRSRAGQPFSKASKIMYVLSRNYAGWCRWSLLLGYILILLMVDKEEGSYLE